MPGEPRSLPASPSVRFLKLEARRRVAAGEFRALHLAQLAIAREHGVASWAALTNLIEARAQSVSHVLPRLRWLIARFADADGPRWVAPDEQELREHFSDDVLRSLSSEELVARFAQLAGDLREEFVVTDAKRFVARGETVGMDVVATVETRPPHRLTGIRALALGGRVRDTRVATPTIRTRGEVPIAVSGIAQRVFRELGLVGLALAAAGPSHQVWSLATGWADLERTQDLGTEERFPAYGITQPVTATAVLRLVADGLVSLDDPANDHLRTVRLSDDTVTVRELLSHTGGVDHPAQSFADRVPELATLTGPLITCSGTRGTFHYSNEGYAAVGQLIADVTGSPYTDAVTRLVLDPLQMSDSSFPMRPDQADGVTEYTITSAGVFVPKPARLFTMPAAGGLWATATDLLSFGQRWSSLLPAALAREAIQPQVSRGSGRSQRGLGWVINQRGGLISSAGQGLGASASLLSRASGRQANVALANRPARLGPVNAQVIQACTASAPGDHGLEQQSSASARPG